MVVKRCLVAMNLAFAQVFDVGSLSGIFVGNPDWTISLATTLNIYVQKCSYFPELVLGKSSDCKRILLAG